MKRMLTSVMVLVATTLIDGRALAWGPAGHKIVAAIAFRQLSPEQQKKIVDILKHHPRFLEDFVDQMPDDVEQSEWYFQQAAVWPDLARGLKPEAKKEFSRPEWHFIDV